ncbi:MAG: SusC/RagA family TonB-linked outer membrane protein, partial [Prevotella sp.]|nr:SusC/RagA family TonB-linked outer membrane protein [Prevotella sp.]
MKNKSKSESEKTKKGFITKLFFASVFLIGTCYHVYAVDMQSLSSAISMRLNDVKLETFFTEIEKNTNYVFLYKVDVNVNDNVSVNVENEAIEEVLKKTLSPLNLTYYVNGNQIVIVKNKEEISVPVTTQSVKRAIKGKVTDSTNEPLIGVSIVIKGTTSGNVTDLYGNYTLDNVSDSDILIFSYIGYISQEIMVRGKNVIDIILREDVQAIDEVVVVGYGTQKKVNLSGAVDVIDNKKLTERQAATVSQLLQGVAPGFHFDVGNQDGFQPGAKMNMTVRGMGSLNGGEPYVLIDGFPGDINNLNPEDIESISVLKDAAASAIYGARAPYGVIIVSTKKGKKNEKIRVNYSGNLIINTPQKLPESLDSYTWTRIQNEAGDNRGGHPISDETIDRIIAYQKQDWEYLKNSMKDWPEGATIFGSYPDGNIWNSANLNYADTDWWDVYFGHSVNQKHDISIQGGGDRISYYFSAGYIDQKSVLNFGKDKFSRMNTMGKIDIAITDWWDFSYETRFAKKYRERPNMTKEGDYSFMYRHISRAYPITPLYDGWGNYTFESHIPSITAGTDRTDDYDYWNNFKMVLRPLKGWTINADFAYNTYTSDLRNVKKLINIHNVDNTVTPNGVSIPNNIRREQSLKNYWTSNIYTSYNYVLNDIHDFGIMAGLQLEKDKYNMMYGYKTDIIVEDVPSLQTATGSSILSETLLHSATVGYFARLNYNYKEKYLLESNIRYDGSYVFRKDNRWGFFPSFSLGWNVHKEAFWENLSAYVNNFKIRGSWGQLGNQKVDPYTDIELVPLQTGKLNWIFNYGDNRPIGYTTAPGIVNRNLTWETATATNLGLDLSFFGNKLQATFDVFQRVTTDMIGRSEAKPGVLGADVPRANNSTLRTRGWELSLNWKQAFENGISYFVNFNLYDYKSVITKYFNPTGTLSTWYKGQEVGEIWGYTVHDLFRTQQELDDYLAKTDLSHLGTNWRTGDLRYEDINGDGKVDNGKNTIDDLGDLKRIGNTQPRWQYGITAGINYKGIDFSMLWRGVGKKDIYFSRMS